MTSNFVHLHVHSEYSLLDGLARTDDLVAQAVKNGQNALALTDHGVMHGVVEFSRSCKAQDVKPIIGVEAYLTPFGRSMTSRDPHKDRARHHLLLLAQNMTGYQNLLKICSAGQLDGYYYKPRIDADFLAAHSDGLVCTSGCMAAEVPYLLNDEKGPADPAKALERLQWYIDVFGKERFFIELQEHQIPALTKINKTLFSWAKEHGLEMIVTNDVHYAQAQDAVPHDTLLCVQTSSVVTAPKRMRMSDQSYYLKSEEEMRRVFQPLADMPDSAFTNTLKIAEMCNVDLEDKSYHLPDLPVELMPPGHNYRTFLRKLTDEGLVERYGERVASPEVQERKEHELSIISKMNFDVYFLIVWDLCEYAIRNNIWWNVRGSGAGSIVAYALGITKIDPLKHHLIFERFLNPGRVSMPDFDLDYPDDQREEMIRYTIRRYGEDHVAQIVSFGRMKARAAIRDVGRAQDVSLDEVDRIAKLVPAISGKPVTIDKTLDSESEFYSAELKKRYKTEDHVKKLIDSARSLEGVARHSSVHAAAVIVADKPLVNYVPLMRPQGSVITKSITQFEFPICDSIGLLKIDFLGLSTLTVMRRAAELIKLRHGIEYTLDNIPVEDPKAFELLASGNLTGIFQVEGAGMRRLMSEMQPHKFDHIVAAISLYRPGPMENIPSYIRRMHGKEEVQYHTPDLKPILEDTYGILVYQEQIIRIAAELAGYEPGEADMIRKAVAKKKTALMEKHKIQFTAGALEKGYSQKVIDAIWGDIEYFARYGFNKAHAADYAAITCQTAFLKAHYQVEYMAALMTVEQHKTDKMGMLMEECRMMGIEVFPPSVNHSDAGFIIEETETGPAIHFGMGAVKNVGEGPIETIIAGREEQPFRDIDDFSQRVDLRKVGKRALESLIKVGALQDFGKRYILLALTERMIRLSGQIHRAAAEGQMSMFDMGGFDAPSVGSIMYPLPDAPEIPRKELLGWEKELMGIYLSSHPIQPHMEAIKQVTTCLCGDLSELRDGRQVRVAGLITKIRQMTTKKGDPMAFVEIEDVQSSLEVVVFPRTYKDYQHLLVPDSIIVVAGKVDGKDEDRPKILADTISTELTVHQPLASEPADAFAESRAAYATPDNGGLMQSAPPPPPPPLPPPLPETAPPDAPHWVTPPTQKEPPTLSKPLEITLLPGDNLAADKLKLQNVLNILRQHPGNSRFVLYIPRNGQRIPIEFPQLQISYTVHLHKELEALVGATGVRAQE